MENADALARLSAHRASTSASDAAGDPRAGLPPQSASSATDRRKINWLAQQRQEVDDDKKPAVPTPISSPYIVCG